MKKRRRDRAEGIGAGQHVGDVDAAVIRPPFLALIGDLRQVVARGSVDHRGIGRQSGGRPGLAVARDRTIDEVGLRGLQHGVVEPEAGHHAGAEILDHDIGGRDQAADDLDRLGPLQVEDDALLAGVELAEGGAGAVAQRRARPHHVALGGFELDHLGAEIGQQPRAMRPGDRRREIHDPQAVEGAGHLRPNPGCHCERSDAISRRSPAIPTRLLRRSAPRNDKPPKR